jgi:hypothetical protein
MLIEIPPPADLVVTEVVVPWQRQRRRSDPHRLQRRNQSSNPGLGTLDRCRLPLGRQRMGSRRPQLLGKLDHDSGAGGLAANASYDGTLNASLPPLKDGNWRLIVRPDLYNEVFEGSDQL